jgi:sigma-E factor negative regulatory protein RseA
MDTPRRLHDPISALVDGEASDDELDLAMAALTAPEGQTAWIAYHLIGDVLRADASGADLGVGFSARLAACLDAEPAPGETLATAAAPATTPSSPETAAVRPSSQPATL